jgi:hypothetical protein
MKRTTTAAARVAAGAGAVSMLGFAAVISAGTAQAAPQDCTVTRDLFGATAACHDVDAPAGREYALIVECFGLHGVPHAFPLMGHRSVPGLVEWLLLTHRSGCGHVPGAHQYRTRDQRLRNGLSRLIRPHTKRRPPRGSSTGALPSVRPSESGCCS